MYDEQKTLEWNLAVHVTRVVSLMKTLMCFVIRRSYWKGGRNNVRIACRGMRVSQMV